MTFNDAKKIIDNIISTEEECYDTKINLELLGKVTYFINSIKDRSFKLSEPSIWFNTLISDGIFIEQENKSIIFISKINELIVTSNSLINLVETTFHELRHHYQNNACKNYYEYFLLHMEDVILDFSKIPYENSYKEIDAFYYSKVKTKEYLKLNDPIYDFYLLNDEYNYKTFNPNYYFDKFNKILRKNYSEKPKVFPCFYNTFYNDDLTFKKVYEIMKELSIRPIDLEIITTVLSSRSFLNQLDFESLTYDELNFLYLVLLEKLNLLISQEITTINYYETLKDMTLPHKKKFRYMLMKYIQILLNIKREKKILNLYKLKITHLTNVINKTIKYKKQRR